MQTGVMRGQPRIQVVGATTLLREGVAAGLSQIWGVRVIHSSALAPPLAMTPTIFLCEIDSIEAVQTLEYGEPPNAYLALIREPRCDLLRALLEKGFAAVITHHASLDEIAHAVERVLMGESYFDMRVQRCLSEVIAHGETRLSDREQQVAILVAKGLTSRTIARELGLCLKTVSNHRRNIFRKLAIHDAVSLTRHAVSSGWVSVDETPPKGQPRHLRQQILDAAGPVSATGSHLVHLQREVRAR
jgi:DNA-binding NarL/FixJ family response regulator